MALLSIGPEICVASLIAYIVHHISLVVRVAISAFEYFCRIRNHVDKYVITKHKKHQLMPLSLATSGIRESVKSNMAK
ncbi:hypothetical protein T02_3144 [Trichinella nativa]|uniref:Uncharacterized protein n=1 Tax=Trichinella nativa TaxID=6335 RepID=A0A0V1KKC2_9BILA|nr:hypothetical protein T02_3144 [Trichinella nativa]